MNPRALGLALIWLGTLLVTWVLVHRFRSGAWSEAAFDVAPPRAAWILPIAALGLVMAMIGLALMVWGLL